MTTKFINSVMPTITHEGGYNDIKSDKGGATNWGISLRFLKSIDEDIDGDGLITYLDIKKLTKDDAISLYYDNFWKSLYEKFPDKLAAKTFDVSVNAGSSRSHILLQRALNKLGSNLKVDGLIGNATLSEIAKYPEQSIVNAFCEVQLEFYKGLVLKDASQSKFLAGWTNRAKYLRKL
jgi:lysozyme family protein